ncbi:hypothetical protein BJ878DRAFT_512116 [Calycina marina]|uniref:Uncharacterized protein n=1 Tax=Calycina marina TaxID=1763456 RepID=A0A9P8CDV6_9HELO|nr:hypothetical protein BJ878DRAFT_512116 [Calycina marina]
MSPPLPAHLISKIGDPIFALFIGLSAAATRINREENKMGHSMQETVNSGFRRIGLGNLYAKGVVGGKK